MITVYGERVRLDIYRAFGQVMVKATDLVTGAYGLGTGESEESAKVKAKANLITANKPEGMVQ